MVTAVSKLHNLICQYLLDISLKLLDREFYCLRPHLFPNMKFSIKPNHTIENGVTVTIECSKGFHQQNADPAEILCENGMWKGRFPICESTFDLISDLTNMTSNLVCIRSLPTVFGKTIMQAGGANNF